MKIKSLKLEFIAIFLLIMMPYKSLGDEFSSVIVALISSIALVKQVKNIKVNKYYLFNLSALNILAIFSLFFTNNMTKSLSGLFIYIVFLAAYLIFSSLNSVQENIIKFIVYTVSVFSLVFIIIQGGIYDIRIDGNIGYANTYSLILLVTLYLNETIDKNSLYIPCELVLLIGIFYTSSRNTLVYLFVFIIIKCVYDIKKQYKFSILINVLIAFLSYAAIQIIGFGMILVLPVLIYCFYHFLVKNIKAKHRNIFAVTLCLLSIPIVFLLPINFVQRLKNLSFTLGVFQERLVYFQDVMPVIFKKWFGSGINSFEYSEYMHQTAFYDVRYIHNSILQVGYDIGIFGAVFFLLTAVTGFFILYKSKNGSRKYFIPIYITIYLHSLLDFDFSYATVAVLTVMIVAFSQETEERNLLSIKINKLIPVALIVFSFYLVLIQFNYYMGGRLTEGNRLEAAEKIYSINKSITIKDPDAYSLIAEIYKIKSNNKDKCALEECADNLKKSHEINPVDPRTIGNLALTYKAMGDKQAAIDAFDKFFSIQRYYPEMYKIYYSYLNELYKNTGDTYYMNKIHELKDRFEFSVAHLNPRAVYMKDQLPKTFEELINN